MHVFALLLAVNTFQPEIPRTWTDAAVAEFEVPLSKPKQSPKHVSEAAYYKILTRTIFRSYPVYHPDREPAGYMEWLRNQPPEVAFDVSKLKSEEDWIKAGELVFNAPVSFGPVFFSAADVRDRAFFETGGMPVAKDGTVPFARWVIREKGKVELGSMGCNTCHTRVMPDGSVLPGAQGNNPGDRQGAALLRKSGKLGDPSKVLAQVRAFARQFEAPGLMDDPNARAQTMSLEQFIAAGEAIPPGVTARSHTSMFLPPQIPDLTGVRERRFLDHTGLVRHRTIGDLMRYSTLVQNTIGLAQYGNGEPPSTARATRYSDEQLYALALYLYSLQPPTNPHRVDAVAARGKKVFEQEGCARCHTPPLYTNNKLIPVTGFVPSAEDKARFDVLAEAVGTDPRYALETPKGTGYYKVPSLKGVWYRGPFEHNGSVATLEDWFDPARLEADYVPTGFRGYDGKTRSVRGHEFGLSLSLEDKTALIAFLKTL